jgi:hypothetical protein
MTGLEMPEPGWVPVTARVGGAWCRPAYPVCGIQGCLGWRVSASSRLVSWRAALALLLPGIIVAYPAGAVVNTVLIAADRAREFAVLRLVGATRRQVLAMMRWETLIVVAAGAPLGWLAMAVPTRMALRPRPVEAVGTRK